jgi:hypothetical protein
MGAGPGTHSFNVPGPMSGPRFLFEPGSATERKLELRVSVECGPPGITAPEGAQWTVKDVRFNVGAWH